MYKSQLEANNVEITSQLNRRGTDKQRRPSHAALNVEQSLLQLQRSHGNQYVQNILLLARVAEGESQVSSEVEEGIQRTRGGGQKLDNGIRDRMESAIGADFSGVRIHTDAQADKMSRAVSARAFTVGRDIYFRQGAYQPGSSNGRELLAHELTHVVQQSGAISLQPKLTVSQPGDRYEQEAEQVAQAYSRLDHQFTVNPEFANSLAQRQAEECDSKESVQTKLEPGLLQRDVDEESTE